MANKRPTIEIAGERMLSQREAANFLGVSRSHLSRRQNLWGLRRIKRPGGESSRIFYRLSDLERLLKSWERPIPN
jgi:hypothetical protein